MVTHPTLLTLPLSFFIIKMKLELFPSSRASKKRGCVNRPTLNVMIIKYKIIA